MRATLELDRELVEEVQRLSGLETVESVMDASLRQYASSLRANNPSSASSSNKSEHDNQDGSEGFFLKLRKKAQALGVNRTTDEIDRSIRELRADRIHD